MLPSLLGLSCQGGKPTITIGESAGNSEYNVSDASNPITNVPGMDAGCAQTILRGQLRPSNLLFVIDRSGSMACNLPSDGQSSAECDQFPTRRFPELPSKWELTRSAINSALHALKGTGRVSVAMTEFPKAGTACTITPAPQLAFRALDEGAITAFNEQLNASDPYGNTPLVGATILSYQYILNKMRNRELEGENFVVLLTDGRETCRNDQVNQLLHVDAVNAYHLLGIRTFVIGVPGSEVAREFLSELAEAGGTVRSRDCYYGPSPSDGNCHIDMTTTANFSTDLLDALTKINAEVLSCTFDIPDSKLGYGVDLTRINVMLNDRRIPYLTSQNCTNDVEGWQYTPGNASIRLCGPTCGEAQLSGSSVSIVLGCPYNVW